MQQKFCAECKIACIISFCQNPGKSKHKVMGDTMVLVKSEILKMNFNIIFDILWHLE